MLIGGKVQGAASSALLNANNKGGKDRTSSWEETRQSCPDRQVCTWGRAALVVLSREMGMKILSVCQGGERCRLGSLEEMKHFLLQVGD